MPKGIIFDIKRYAIHDGPGIRSTVFFKGCSLQCQWCHNPEGIQPEPEIFLRKEKCPSECRFCISACPNGAIKRKNGSIKVDLSRCDLCSECEDSCVYGALEIIGRELSPEEVMTELEKDSLFYEESHGGVSFSGGEPFEQPEFLDALLEISKSKDLHTTVDTCGHFSPELLSNIDRKVDLFLYDLKMIDDKKHRKYTGKTNKIILENLRSLTANGHQVVIRIPLIRGINDDDQNIEQTVEFLMTLNQIKQINLLPYHSGGCLKQKRLEKKEFQPEFQSPSIERIEAIKNIFKNNGFSVKVGG
ncbi:MAG: glycyl-radical enzyme activating protein [Candidatus Aminicenantes bacterium]|nr:glycyl-radical enzyme activating protein [Candidatus Aminicenantes bacterium]